MLTCTLYTLTGPVKLSQGSMTYLNMHFSKYPPPPIGHNCVLV